MHASQYLFSLAALAATTIAQQTTPSRISALNLEFVDAQYAASGYGLPARPNSLSTGFNLTSKGLLAVRYGQTVIQNGGAYAAGDVATMPTVFITPQKPIDPSYEFTLMLVDVSALNNPDAQGVYRHYLANSITPPINQTATQPANLTFTPTVGTALTPYAGPGPIAGTGMHRYAWLLFTQPANFMAAGVSAATLASPGHWDPVAYCKGVNCGVLVAATFFTVENAAPTFVSVATSAINTATLVTSSAKSSRTISGTGASGVAAAAAATNKNGTVAATGDAARSLVSLAAVSIVAAMTAASLL